MIEDINELITRLDKSLNEKEKIKNENTEMKKDISLLLKKLDKYMGLYEISLRLYSEASKELKNNTKIINKQKKMLNNLKKNVIMASVGMGVNIDNLKVLPNINTSFIYMRDIKLLFFNILLGGGISFNVCYPFNNISSINNIGLNLSLAIKL